MNQVLNVTKVCIFYLLVLEKYNFDIKDDLLGWTHTKELCHSIKSPYLVKIMKHDGFVVHILHVHSFS